MLFRNDASPSSSHDHPMPQVDPQRTPKKGSNCWANLWLLLLAHSCRIPGFHRGTGSSVNVLKCLRPKWLQPHDIQMVCNGLPAVFWVRNVPLHAWYTFTSYPSYGLAGCAIDESHTIWARKSWKRSVNKDHIDIPWRLACANEWKELVGWWSICALLTFSLEMCHDVSLNCLVCVTDCYVPQCHVYKGRNWSR